MFHIINLHRDRHHFYENDEDEEDGISSATLKDVQSVLKEINNSHSIIMSCRILISSMKLISNKITFVAIHLLAKERKKQKINKSGI